MQPKLRPRRLFHSIPLSSKHLNKTRNQGINFATKVASNKRPGSVPLHRLYRQRRSGKCASIFSGVQRLASANSRGCGSLHSQTSRLVELPPPMLRTRRGSVPLHRGGDFRREVRQEREVLRENFFAASAYFPVNLTRAES